MALVYADNSQNAYVEQPPVKAASNIRYGKERVFYDTIDFSASNASIGDDVVIGSLTVGATVWGDFSVYATTGMTASSTVQLGFLSKEETPVFTALAGALDVTTADTRVGWSGADSVASAALPASVADQDAWLVLRVAGANATAGVIKAEVSVTVE